MDIKDILIRLLKTFIQGFVGALVVTLPSSDYSDMSVLKSILIGACAGGISAIMNLALQYMNNTKKQTTLNDDTLEDLMEGDVENEDKNN